MTRVYGYTRVSTDEQASSDLGLAAQRTAIDQAAAGRGWEVEWATDAGISGSAPMVERQAPALAGISRGDVLVVAKLDRLSRSLADFAALMERSAREGRDLVALELGVDTTTPTSAWTPRPRPRRGHHDPDRPVRCQPDGERQSA